MPTFSAFSMSASDVPRAAQSAMNFATSGRDFAICLRQRMIGREREEAGAEQRVGARGEDFDRIGRVVAAARILVARQGVGRVGDLPPDLRALRFADPVALHGADLVRPAVEAIEGGQQIIAIARDAEEPLLQLALFDDGAGAPAASIDDLFVGQHGVLDRIPVHFRGAAIDEIVRQHLQEDALLLFVIVRLAGGDFLRPVEGQAQRRELVLHRLDVLQRPRRAAAPSSRWRRSRRAGRTRPSPSGAARYSRWRCDSARRRRPWRSCAHGPCAAGPTGRGTSRGRRPSACRPLPSRTSRGRPARAPTRRAISARFLWDCSGWPSRRSRPVSSGGFAYPAAERKTTGVLL